MSLVLDTQMPGHGEQVLDRDAQTAQGTVGRAERIAEDRPDAGVQRGLRRAPDDYLMITTVDG
jgi:hypothetical protein